MNERFNFSSLLSAVPRRPLEGMFYRALPEAAVPYALEDGPSYSFLNRYNVKNRFGALYFGDRIEVCRATLEKRGLLTTRAVPHVILSFNIQVTGVLDVTDDKIRESLNVSREALVRSIELPSAYEVCHTLAAAVYEEGNLSGMLVPDATETGHTLVLYPARLLSIDLIHFHARVPF